MIEILLLVARGAMAIVYGFTIHDLESAVPEAKPAPSLTPASEVEDLVRKALDAFVTQQ